MANSGDEESDSTTISPENVGWHERLSHFTWSWFSCTMSTGALASLLSNQAYTFTGLETIGKIVFIVDLVLFVTFSILITYRFLATPASFLDTLHHPCESFFFGSFLVSLALLIFCTNQYGIPACGPWLVRTVEILYWVYASIALFVVIFQYHVIFDTESLPVREVMPGWILPAYPFLVLGPLAAVITEHQPPSSSLRILISGVLFQGLGWTLAFLVYTLYFTRLVAHKMPEPAKRPGMYVSVGPAAYTSNALVALGNQAAEVLPPGFMGISSFSVGEVWKAVGLPAGMFLWLVAFWFFAVASVSILTGCRRLHFTLNHWAFIFPNVGLTMAVIQIGETLDSPAIKAVSSAMTVLLVLAWIIVAILHVRAVCLGNILWPGKDEDMAEIERDEVGVKEKGG